MEEVYVIKTPPKWQDVECRGFNVSQNSSNKKLVDKTKYKTEMCRQWQRKQSCSYGYKCQYAHGKAELIQK